MFRRIFDHIFSTDDQVVDKSTFSLEYFLLVIFSVLTLALSVFQLMFPKENLSWYDYYTGAGIIISCAAILYYAFVLRKNWADQARFPGLFFWCFFLIFCWRFFELSQMGISMDESSHLFFLERHSIVMAGLRQNNPPLNGLYLQPLINWFGTSPWILKIPSLLFGGLSVILFFRLLKSEGLSNLSATMFTSLYAFHPVVSIYMVEARPIALGLFTMFLFLGLAGKSQDRLLERSNLLLILATAFIAFLSVGLQPVVLGAGVGIYALIRSCKEIKYLKLATVLLLAFLFFFPLLNQIFSVSPIHVGQIAHGKLEPFFRSFRFENYSSLIDYYLFPYVFVALPALFLVARNPKGFWGSLNHQRFWLLLSCFLSPILIFVPLYFGYVKGPFRVYYLLILFPVFLLLLANLWGATFKRFSKIQRIFAESFILLFCLCAFLLGWNVPKQFSDDFYRADLRLAIQTVTLDANETGPFLLLEVCPYGSERWCPDEPFYVNLYLTPFLSEQRIADSIFAKEQVLQSYRDIFRNDIKVDNLYLLFQNMNRKRTGALKEFIQKEAKFQHAKVWEIDGFAIVKLPLPSLDDRIEIRNIFSAIKKNCLTSTSDCFWPKTYLALMYSGMGERARAQELAQDIFYDQENKAIRARKADYDIYFDAIQNILDQP